MTDFSVLGALALQLHEEFVRIFYLLLPVFFMLALVIDWFRNPAGSGDFLVTFKRAFVATILLVSFQELSEAILAVTTGIAERIDDLKSLDNVIKMAGDKAKSYPMSPTSVILAIDDAMIAILTFLSYLILYVARYLIVALYHFMWLFLSITAPLLLLFHLFKGTSQIPLNLFKSMIEVASYKIVWAIMSAMMAALAFGNAYAADGNYLTVILLNFVIAIAMLGTPLIVKSLVGNGITAAAESLGMGAVVMMAAAPARAATAARFGREVVNDTKVFAGHHGGKLMSAFPPTRTFSTMLNKSASSESTKVPSLPPAPPK